MPTFDENDIDIVMGSFDDMIIKEESHELDVAISKCPMCGESLNEKEWYALKVEDSELGNVLWDMCSMFCSVSFFNRKYRNVSKLSSSIKKMSAPQ